MRLAPILLALTTTVSATDSSTTLWFDKPARSFHESLPLGDGRIGAMEFGGVDEERIVLNEISLWTGQELSSDDYAKMGAYQMLGEILDDLRDALHVDTVPLASPMNAFGFPNDGWKPWTLTDGAEVLVPGKFNTVPDEHGVTFMYPQGDTAAPPTSLAW